MTSPNAVSLHYNANIPPSGGGSASPASVVRNQRTTISVTTTNGSDPVSTVTLNAMPIGGSSSVTLVPSAVPNVYTNDVIIGAVTATGPQTLVATITDTGAGTGSANIALTVSATAEVWDGGSTSDDNFSNNTNWVSNLSPGLVGDSLTFAGTARLTPNLNTNYTVTALTFSNDAGAFTIGTANGSTLTLAGGVTNNSANGQTLNVPATMSGTQTFNAAAGDLTLGQNITNGGSLVTVSGASNTTMSADLSGTGGLTKTGDGTLTVSGTTTYSGANTISAGRLTVTGTINSTAAATTVGNTAASNARLIIAGGSYAANFNAGAIFSSSINLGTAATSPGDIQMSSGTFTVNRQIALGTVGYGAFSQSGGATTIGGFIALGATANGGVINQSGGTITLSTAPATIGYSATAAIAAMNLSGTATFNANGASGNGVWPGEVGTGTLNILGTAALNIPNDGIILGKANTTLSKGLVNFNGGTSTVKSVSKGTGTGIGGFNGGTLKANVNNAAFLTGLTEVNVFSGGAVIDDGGFAITVGQALLAPSGSGVSLITLTSGGAGYIDAPLVTITGGGGSNATAIAQIDYAAGTVTNILITSPGANYATAPAVALVGGGASSPATINTVTLAANTSGGFTKTGAGTLTLSAANTYSGNTTISNGALALSGSGAIGSSPVITVNSGATFDVSGVSFTLGSGQTLKGNGSVNGAATLNGTVAPGTSIGTLTFTNAPTLGGTVLMEISTPASADKINFVTGTVSFGGTLTVTNIGPSLTNGNSFDLLVDLPG